MTETDQADNCVLLRGTLTGPALDRRLADGADVSTFQLLVARPPSARGRTDVLDCAARDAAVRKSLRRCADGDRLEVTGWVQRRFWRGAAGLVSRYEIEVESLRKLRRG